MRAAVWYDEKDVRVEERAIKDISNHEVKIKVAWAGICGSDLHEYLEGPITIPAEEPDPLTGKKAPITLGHEFSGVVEEVGSEVSTYKKGDRVVVNPLLTYGNKAPKYDVYDGFNFIGLGVDGGFAEYVVVPENHIYPLPDDMSLEEGALVEPTAVAVQALKEGDLKAGQSVAVFGAGPIGLLAVAAAKAEGAGDIAVFDLSESRLEMAKRVGATQVINSGKQNPLEAAQEMQPGGFDVVLEAAGVEQTVNQAIKVTKTRGIMVIVSIFANPVKIHPMDLTASGVKITSSAAYEPAAFQRAIDLISSDAINAQEIITNRIELRNIVNDGFKALTEDKSEVKILVELSGKN